MVPKLALSPDELLAAMPMAVPNPSVSSPSSRPTAATAPSTPTVDVVCHPLA